MSTKSTKDSDDVVCTLKSDVRAVFDRASFDMGTRISANAFVTPKSKAFRNVDTDRIFDNTIIEFDLDSPGALDIVSVDNNWGVGPQGYDLNQLSSIGANGKKVRIGIADSGIDSSHPAFTTLVSEHRLVSFAAFAADGSKVVQRAEDGSAISDSSASPTNTHWHGTFCSAILVGAPTEGKARGLAPQAELAVAQVLQQGSVGSVASIMAGLAWLADQKCDVVSLSLGWDGKHDQWSAGIRALLDQGTVIVAAAGNSFGIPGVGPSDSPGNYPLEPSDPNAGILLSVGAIDQADHLADVSGAENADWSNVMDRQPDGSTQASPFATFPPRSVPIIVGPGVAVISASPGNRYREESGTSMATPHVAGLIACVLSVLRTKKADVTPRQAAECILSSLTTLENDSNPNRFGRGKVNISVIMQKLQDGISL